MSSYKKTARTVGILILFSTAAYMIGGGLLASVLNHSGFLADLYPNRMKVMAGVILEFMTAAAVVGVAWSIFPVLKQHDEATALGYFGTRIVESVLIIVSLTGPLLLVIVSQEYLSSGAADESFYRLIANIAVNGHYLAFDFAMLALGLGSLMFCYLLYQSKLVPRFLSVIGLIGYAALAASSGLGFFGLDMRMILYLPGAIFELLFPIWLIVKGFNENATYSGALDENTVV